MFDVSSASSSVNHVCPRPQSDEGVVGIVQLGAGHCDVATGALPTYVVLHGGYLSAGLVGEQEDFPCLASHAP